MAYVDAEFAIIQTFGVKNPAVDVSPKPTMSGLPWKDMIQHFDIFYIGRENRIKLLIAIINIHQ